MRSRACWLGLMPLTIASVPLGVCAAQPARVSAPTAVMGAVMRYRLYWLGDSTPFAACPAYRALGRPADFPSALEPAWARLLDRDVGSCDAGTPAAAVPQGPVVRTDTLILADSTAELRLTVRRGEYRHQQRYTLRRSPFGPSGSWWVESVWLSAGIQVHGGPPAIDTTTRRPR